MLFDPLGFYMFLYWEMESLGDLWLMFTAFFQLSLGKARQEALQAALGRDVSNGWLVLADLFIPPGGCRVSVFVSVSL